MSGPKSSDVLRALRRHVHVRAHSMRRFSTGLAHHVYEVMTDADPVVVRMADPKHWNGIPGGVYWHPRLKQLGVPVPELIGYKLDAPYPYMILERLPGRDLGAVYTRLSSGERQSLARKIVAVQDLVAALPPADRYGWLDSYESPTHSYGSWPETLEAGLRKAEQFFRENENFDSAVIDRVREAAEPFRVYLSGVPAAPFLDDTTTKNVIVYEGSLSGIVDTDVVCFGDRLYVLALTKMSLLASGDDLDYIEAWAEAWHLDGFQRRVVDLYAAMHGVYFMGEIGRRWNREAALQASAEAQARLVSSVEMLIASVVQD